MSRIRFDGAWHKAQAVARDASDDGYDVILVRDLLGRVSLIVDDREKPVDHTWVDAFKSTLSEETAPFSGDQPIVLASELFEPEVFFNSLDLVVSRPRNRQAGSIGLIERGLMGAEWNRGAFESRSSQVVLYGFKGGVGRSTATVILAEHLADTGKCVLVVDLDLESPGVSVLLSPNESLPDFGLVDYLVESAVGNAEGLDLVNRVAGIKSARNGEVWLAPASGKSRAGYNYVAKLNRVYSDLSGAFDDEAKTFGARLQDAIDACTSRVEELSRKPDVVLLDSRAGIHDVAAAAITQLSDLALLFATNNAATWAGYRSLFGQWGQSQERAVAMREKIRMVAAMVPPTSPESYLRSFRDSAQECFAETLYDDVDGSDLEGFNPGPEVLDAPHAPLPILFSSDLIGINHELNPKWQHSSLVRAAYEEFLTGSTRLITGEL
ncbi:tyrosine-protein kinase family protein [Streptomyces sp. A0642]|uniref:KGGVGR-motif variant AAA ATPase n=1 Tax=Streptomyces sp. A0642 TaxID=2563100 RepID=UPI0010A1F988|nr:AAA family ATPase [Streptomyces sp. A0642]THA78431.1 tyrosine-protein kinase family protein [Streptomyces sp. A0642]